MIQEISLKLATQLKRIVPEHPRSVEVLKYGISFLINTFSIIVLSIIISVFTGHTLDAVIALISYALLRQVSGGFHLKSGGLCIAISTLGITMISFSDFNQNIIYILTIASLVIVLLFAPSEIGKQTRIPPKYYPLLKVLCLVIVGSNFLFCSSVLASSFLVQSLTLVRGRR